MKPYNLIENKNSDTFYKKLDKFVKDIFENQPEEIKKIINEFHTFQNSKNLDEVKTEEEYYIEILAAGIYFEAYAGKSIALSFVSVISLFFLNKLRIKLLFLKSAIDYIRGKIIFRYLFKLPKINADKNKRNFKTMIRFLKASGDFENESLDLKIWYLFLKSLKDEIAKKYLNQIIDYSKDVLQKADSEFELYFSEIEEYIKANNFKHVDKENSIYVSRTRPIYYYNIISAQILNKMLRKNFISKDRFIILLPTCMILNPKSCQKKKSKGYSICARCNINCNVYKTISSINDTSIEARLIPHSSAFSKHLQKENHDDNTGYVGISCILNLVNGGLELIKNNISSQCVYLDFCGCEKHWQKKRIATNLNINRLNRILNKQVK